MENTGKDVMHNIISPDATKVRERKPKRADIQIYRPGALRLMKELSLKDKKEISKENIEKFDSSLKEKSTVSEPPVNWVLDISNKKTVNKIEKSSVSPKELKVREEAEKVATNGIYGSQFKKKDRGIEKKIPVKNKADSQLEEKLRNVSDEPRVQMTSKSPTKKEVCGDRVFPEELKPLLDSDLPELNNTVVYENADKSKLVNIPTLSESVQKYVKNTDSMNDTKLPSVSSVTPGMNKIDGNCTSKKSISSTKAGIVDQGTNESQDFIKQHGDLSKRSVKTPRKSRESPRKHDSYRERKENISYSNKISVKNSESNQTRNLKSSTIPYDAEKLIMKEPTGNGESKTFTPFTKSTEISERNISLQKNCKQDIKPIKHSNKILECAQNVHWTDEKWSPSQKQRKHKKHKEIIHIDGSTQRGIIPFQIASSLNDSSSETVSSGNSSQKVLFNPNNPSKPLIVSSSGRDSLSSSWDSALQTANDASKNVDEAPNWNTPEDVDRKIDPAVFYNIQKGEMDINYYISSNQLPQEFRRIMDIRKHLQICYRQLLMCDIRLCQEKNIEGALWKSLYYTIIEKLREYINRDPSLKDRSLSTLHMLVDEGQVFLQGLISDLQKYYEFSLDLHIEKDITTHPSTRNRVKQAIHSCQKLLLSIGDLSRYKEQYNTVPNFLQARKWYQMALQVQPRNGRPFNQLAIVAVSQKRPLDVVYYYVRSLSATNPFTSAKDSLVSIFDDIRKKYESLDKKPSEEKKVQNRDRLSYKNRRGEGLRREIWIRPDSGVTNKRTLSQSEPEEEHKSCIAELQQLPTEQLTKSFLTCYLHCHGMLFSKVGLEHFSEVLQKTLNLFQALLKLSPPRISPTYLLQIMTINMFAIDNNQLRDSRLESGYRSAAQDLALLLAQEMFARLSEAMVFHFPSSINYSSPGTSKQDCEVVLSSSPSFVGAESGSVIGSGDSHLNLSATDRDRLFLYPLSVFIPAAKVWCDWLLYQSLIWNPPPQSHDALSGFDSWSAVGELATIVKGIGPPDVPLTEESSSIGQSHLQEILLQEDKFLRAYGPVVPSHRNSYFAPRTFPIERSRDWVRLKNLQLCLCQFLCGVQPPVLKLQKTDKGEILVPVVTTTPPDTPSLLTASSSSSSQRAIDDSESDSGSSNPDDEMDDFDGAEGGGASPEGDFSLASTVKLLAHRKKILEKKQKQQRKLQALIEGSVTLEMEIRPRYLVPDTNCFIEHIDIIKGLINKPPYTLMVPLVVINELEGLSKDAAVDKYGDVNHAVKVREGASSALHYLNTHKNPSLKYVTSEGSVLLTSTFTDEVNFDQESSNDDKILSCCINFCSANNKRNPVKDDIRHLYREVVLLTEDRNLRIKAYACDVPVRDLLDFAHWAGIK